MGHLKTFLPGMATAYGIYYITKKRADGTSILDDLKDNPSFFFNTAKGYAVEEAVDVASPTLNFLSAG